MQYEKPETSTIFTDLFIKNLKPEDNEYTRREAGGFGVRVYPTGRKTFFFLYRVDGVRRFSNLGEYHDKRKGDARGDKVSLQEARELYETERLSVRDLKRGRAGGVDPVEERKRQQSQRKSEAEEQRISSTMAEFAKVYVEKWAKPNKRSWQSDERILQADIIPRWGYIKLKEIKRKDVRSLLEEVGGRAPVMANRIRVLLSKVFNFALERELIEINPCTGVKDVAKEKARDRILDEAEIQALWKALDDPVSLGASLVVAAVLKFVLITGQRPGEVSGLPSQEIDGEWWTLPAARAKNKTEHRIYLPAIARQMIPEGERYVFSSPLKVQPVTGCSVSGLVRRALVQIKPGPSNPAPAIYQRDADTGRVTLNMPQWTPHDLRRTMATKLSEMGFGDETIDAVLNHKKRGIVATYNRNRYDREKQEAMEAWERRLLEIVADKG